MKEVKQDKIKGLAILIMGFLTTLMGFLATLNIHFHWLTDASISAFGALFVAAVMLGGSLYAIWKNTFVSKKAQKQNKELHKRKLK